MKTGGHNPNDGATHPVEHHALTDNPWILAVLPRPKPLGDHHSGIRANAILLNRESSSQSRIHTKNLEESCGNHFAMQVLGLPLTEQVETSLAIYRQGTETAVHAAPIFEVRIRDGTVFEVGHLGK